MAKPASLAKMTVTSELRFWACVAVALALFAQVLFPPQVMAATGSHGTQFVLCTSGMDSAPILDETAAKLFKTVEKSPPKSLNGLKCAQCVLASITAITTPLLQFQPVVYKVSAANLTPPRRLTPVQARAPPRPHSCGPPSEI